MVVRYCWYQKHDIIDTSNKLLLIKVLCLYQVLACVGCAYCILQLSSCTSGSNNYISSITPVPLSPFTLYGASTTTRGSNMDIGAPLGKNLIQSAEIALTSSHSFYFSAFNPHAVISSNPPLNMPGVHANLPKRYNTAHFTGQTLQCIFFLVLGFTPAELSTMQCNYAGAIKPR